MEDQYERINDLNEYLLITSISPERHLLVGLLEKLLAYPEFNPSIDNNKAIIIASEFDRDDLVKILLEHPLVDPGAQRNEAIFRAAADGHVNIVRILMNDLRVDPSDWKNRVLNYAISGRRSPNHNKPVYVEIVKLLLNDHRVDWRMFKTSIMLQNIYNEKLNNIKQEIINIGSNEVYRKIINKSCDNNKRGNVPPMDLIILSTLLGVRPFRDTKEQLCEKIKHVLITTL